MGNDVQLPFTYNDKVRLFSEIAELKTMVSSMEKRLDKLPCPSHMERVGDLSLRVERMKTTMVLSMVSVFTSIGTIIGVVVMFLKP